jgi:RNA polymerase sigma factor (sigma-70 family)
VADVVAQTFVRLLEVVERYDPARGEPGPFVLAIAANLVRDLYRRDARQRALIWRLSGPDLLVGDDIERVEAALDAAEAVRWVPGALDGVPPGEREVLRLVAEGRTPGQAADELGISPGAAWTRLSRARRRVRTRIRAIEEERK